MTVELDNLQEMAALLKNAQHIAVLTGAGISKESGIPTFRDAQTGMWAKYSPEDLATRDGFLQNPSMVWDWYDHRRNAVWNVDPNPGHNALATLEAHANQFNRQFTLITQNIDNLHRQAGSKNVLELHGNIFRYKTLDANQPINLDDLTDEQRAASPPRCPKTGHYIRPDVVWFGELLPNEILAQAFQAATDCDVMLVVGTSGVVHPAAAIPGMAKQSGATIIEINPDPSALTTSTVNHFLQGPAGAILPLLVEAVTITA